VYCDGPSKKPPVTQQTRDHKTSLSTTLPRWPCATFGAAPNIIANWEQDSDNAITLPIGLGINKTVQFGKVPVRFGVEAYYSVVQPDDVVGSKWNFRFYMIPAAPAALFEWMTKPLFGG